MKWLQLIHLKGGASVEPSKVDTSYFISQHVVFQKACSHTHTEHMSFLCLQFSCLSEPIPKFPKDSIMLGFSSLFFVLFGAILVSAPYASATERTAVDFAYGKLAEEAEAERGGYCSVCHYLCELLQDQQVNEILDPMDDYMRPWVEKYLLPLVRDP